MTQTTSVNIRDAPMQKTANKIIRATEQHGRTQTTSVNIRETPMQKTTNKSVALVSTTLLFDKKNGGQKRS